MGMFGAGRAFNLSFRPQPFGNPGSMRRIPMPMMGNYSQTTNVTIKNGPSGFWGFMGGLFGGLTGNVGMGGLFGGFGMPGMMGGAPCFMGMNTGIGSGVYGMLNGSQQNGPLSESQQIGNLKELFKGFGYTGVIGNGDGTFTIFGGDKGPKTMTYKEAVKFAETLGPKAQGTDPTGKKDNPNTKKDDPELKSKQDEWIKKNPNLELTRLENGTAQAKNGDIYEWKDNAYVKKQTQATSTTTTTSADEAKYDYSVPKGKSIEYIAREVLKKQGKTNPTKQEIADTQKQIIEDNKSAVHGKEDNPYFYADAKIKVRADISQ